MRSRRFSSKALLRQSGGFEGFLPIEKDPDAQELAVFQFVQIRERLTLAESRLWSPRPA